MPLNVKTNKVEICLIFACDLLVTVKSELDTEEYSFSPTTLEQVFLKFAHYDEVQKCSMVPRRLLLFFTLLMIFV